MSITKKTNWQVKKLGEVCDIFNGNSINAEVKKEKYFGRDSGYPFIATKDVSFTNKIDYENGVKIPKNNFNFKTSKSNSVLICAEGGSAGRKIGFTEKEVCFGNKLFSLHSDNQDNKFIYYFCFTDYFQKEFKKSLTGIIGGVSLKKFKDIEIHLPSLVEQYHIVKILDETFEKIEKAKENAKKNLQNSKELFESYLNNIFASSGDDWCEKKISDICDIGAGNSAPQKKELFVGGKYPFFRTSDVGRIHIGIISDSSDYLNDKGIKGLRLFNKGTILLPKSGASTFLNHRVVLGIDGYVSSHLATIKTDENILNNNYLFYFLQRIKAQDLIQDHKYPSLNLPVIGGIKISYPSLSEQKYIVAKLDKLSAETKKLEVIYRQKLADLEELKKSILKKAFNGEL